MISDLVPHPAGLVLINQSFIKKTYTIVEMHQNVNLLQSRFLCLHSKYIYHSGKGAEEEKKTVKHPSLERSHSFFKLYVVVSLNI